MHPSRTPPFLPPPSPRAPFPTLAVLGFAAMMGLSGCTQGTVATPILPDPICEISALNQGWDLCKEGQVMAYLPPSFGNEQLPVIAAALYCDFHHPVVHTTGGVSCIYTGTRKPPPSND